MVAYGPGLQPQMVREGVPATFTVDSTKTSNATLDVKVKTDRGSIGKPEIKRIRDGVHEVTYMPGQVGSTATVEVNYGGKPVQNSPFKIKVEPGCDPNKVVLSGPGVSPVTTASFPADFVVDTSKAGFGDLEVQVLVSVNFAQK